MGTFMGLQPPACQLASSAPGGGLAIGQDDGGASHMSRNSGTSWAYSCGAIQGLKTSK